MMMVAFLMGGWLMTLELRRRRLAEDYSADMVAAAVIGGIIGAKLWYVALTRDPGALFQRGGLVWYGGFIGGTAGGDPQRLAAPGAAPLDHAARRPGAGGGVRAGPGRLLPRQRRLRPAHVSLPWAVKFPAGPAAVDRRQHAAMFGIPIPPGIDPIHGPGGAPDPALRDDAHAGRLRRPLGMAQAAAGR